MSSTEKLLKSGSLLNGLVDVMLVLGIDENTGLIPAEETEKYTNKEIYDNLYCQDFETPVVAAVTANKAYFFHPSFREDLDYPVNKPQPQTQNTGEPRKGKKRTEEKSLSHPAITYKPSSTNKRSLSVPAIDLPVSGEVLNSLPTFCFPDHARICREKGETKVHFLVLTDISGKKTYATCIIFYKPYVISQDKEHNIHFSPVPSKCKAEKSCFTPAPPDGKDDKSYLPSVLSDGREKSYLPQCCVLISKHPYFYSMKECLSCLVGHIERDLEEMYQFVKEVTYFLCMTPVPPPGNVQIEFRLYTTLIILPPSEWPDTPVVNIPLHLVFLIFSVPDILKVVTAILMEEKIVFLSSDYALLTVVMESFLYFMLPFRWRYSYVPILSDSSLDFLEAVGAYMMGCHFKHLSFVQQINDIVLVDIERGTVSINQVKGDNCYPTADPKCSRLPQVPQESANLFLHHFTPSKYHRDLSDVSRTFASYEDEKRDNMKRIQKFNSEISFAFLELMVNLFRGVISELKIEVRHFNQVGFLETVSEESRPFYEKVFPTSIFRAFLEDRLNEKQDYWSELELKSRSAVKRMSITTLPPKVIGSRKMFPRKQVSVSCFSVVNSREFVTWSLPGIIDVNTFMRKCIENLTSGIATVEDHTARCCFRYLRAMFRAAAGNYLQSLDDLFNLPSGFTHQHPKELIRGMMKDLGETERNELLKQKGYHQQLERLMGEENRTVRRPIKVDIVCPDHDLYKDEFFDVVSLRDMASDYDTCMALFDALKTFNCVDKYTFEMFDVTYIENQRLRQDCLMSLKNNDLGADESILTVSSLVKTDHGTGRIVLTDKRLFLLKDGSNVFKDLIRLHDINIMEKTQLHAFLKAVDVISIQNHDESIKFCLWLKEQCNRWFLLIQEMMSGRIVSIAMKDHSITHQASQNVLLINSVIKSGVYEDTAHHDHINMSAELLCHYTRYVADGKHILPPDTLTVLQKRVDPSQGERQRTTVESLLYTPGFNAKGEEHPPRLWCGMGDKKIRIFDASTFLLEPNHITTSSNVITFASVGATQVWAGALGIYIIDTVTMTTSKILTDHKDLVTSIFLTSDQKFAFSGSLDGVIIKWEIPSLKTTQVVHLEEKLSLRSIKLADSKLWCGTWEGIHVFDQAGKWLIRLDLKTMPNMDLTMQELECFEITPNEVWAGLRKKGMILIWDRETKELKTTIRLSARGISTLVLSNDKMWVGTKQKEIYIYTASSHKLWKRLTAHTDAIRCMCQAEDRYIMSGSCSNDGKVAIWSQTINVDSGSYNEDNPSGGSGSAQ